MFGHEHNTPPVLYPRCGEQLWKTNDRIANKKGVHKTVFMINGDKYIGDWLNNLKDGKGTYVWKKDGSLYDGDWKEDMRNGFGTLSVPAAGGGFRKQYSGGWKNDKKHGYGVHYYENDLTYEGEWACGKRHGWGRMHYPDCSVYEGEWYDDKRHGEGMHRLENGNRYEGSWKNDMKNGEGKYFHLDKGQVFEGIWKDDGAKCGEMRDLARETAPEATPYPLPELGLADPAQVLEEAAAPYPIVYD